MIEQRCLRPEQLAAMIAGDMLFVGVRADVLDEAILVLQLLVAQRPVALGLGPLVVWRLLYLIFKGGVLHNVILELDYGNERALAVTPAAMEILFQLGQLVAFAWQCIAGRYLGMELALVLALEQQINVIAMIVTVPFEFFAAICLKVAIVPYAYTFVRAL